MQIADSDVRVSHVTGDVHVARPVQVCDPMGGDRLVSEDRLAARGRYLLQVVNCCCGWSVSTAQVE